MRHNTILCNVDSMNTLAAGVVSDMLVCLETVGKVDVSVLRLLPSLIPTALKIIETYWSKDVLRNQALSMLAALLQHHLSAMQRDLLLDLSGVSVVSRCVFGGGSVFCIGL